MESRPLKRKEQKLADNMEDEIDSVSKLLEIYVTSIRENDAYNSKYMSHYYNLLLLLAGRHVEFCRKMLDHNNWRWSLRAFVLGSTGRDCGSLSQIIFQGTLRYVEEDDVFRDPK